MTPLTLTPSQERNWTKGGLKNCVSRPPPPDGRPVPDPFRAASCFSAGVTGPACPSDSIAFSTIRGKSYGFAFPGSLQKNEGLVIRKDWLDKLGLSMPTTLDELYDVCYAFTFKDPDGNGKNDTYGYGAFGVAGTWNMTEKNFGLNAKKPEFFEALKFVNKMVENKVIDPDWPSLKKDDFRAAWKQGKFGVMREQMAALAAQANYAPFDKNFPNGEWAALPPPKGPKGLSATCIYDANGDITDIGGNGALLPCHG